MLIQENSTVKWSQIINEEYKAKGINITGDKLDWMAKYAQVHEIYEGLQSDSHPVDGNIYSTPLNTLGMGNPMMPMGVGYNAGGDGSGVGNTGSDFHNFAYKAGSGDIPMSTLTMALEVAAMTIGLELVPVIPATGPWAMLQYMDFPYAGGKLMRLNETTLDGKGPNNTNKPIYIKISADLAELKAVYDALDEAEVSVGDTISIGAAPYVQGMYLGKSRIDNGIIIKVISILDDSFEETSESSIADVFVNSDLAIYDSSNAQIGSATLSSAHADVVATYADHVQEFSNFFGDGAGGSSDDPMTRAQNETGVGNTIGARMFSKMIQMGSYEVTGSVTRQQLQDMPLYGIDVVGQVLEAMQNELSQAINNRILDRLFKLGTTNAVLQKQIQGVDLNLFFSASDTETKALSDFTSASKFIGIDDTNAATDWGDISNAVKGNNYENTITHQRRIFTRVLAATNLIANVSRFGRANWVVTNTQVLSALQDCSGFQPAPFVNTLSQDHQGSIYFAGTLAGLNLYVDPYMQWNDCRVLVGRKSDGKTPGVVFMPYILADKVQIVAEGTFATKLLMNSRFAIVDCGFHPEQNYFCFMIDTDEGYIL